MSNIEINGIDINLHFLKNKYKYPDKKPEFDFDDRGWFPECNQKVISKFIKDTKLILELGSWLGKSTRFLAENSNATVISVDHWKGGNENEEEKNLYEKFILNCWKYNERIIPLKMDTKEGMVLLYNLKLKPDLIYIDAGHDYESAKQDIMMAGNLFPNAIFIGDDFNPFNWDGVVKGVWECIVEKQRSLSVYQSCWWSLPKCDIQ